MKTLNHTKPYKVGSIVLATEQGLGYLAKDFYDNGIIDYVHIQPHSSRTNHYEWYKENLTKDELLDKCDVILFFETAFDWKMIPRARERGIKTVLMPMYECTPNPLPYSPDLILSPSKLDSDYYPVGEGITVPVDVPFKLRKKAEVFVHNAGNGGLGGRNGTRELLEAMKYVKSPIKLIVRSQIPIKEYTDPRIFYEYNVPREKLWDKGDIFIFPEKFNGLSLPIQEAFASGMPVMCGNRYPMNTWLPNDLLIPVLGYKKERLACVFDSAIIDPKDIAETIDKWYNKDITKYSLDGRDWAKNNSWKKHKEIYEKLLLP